MKKPLEHRGAILAPVTDGPGPVHFHQHIRDGGRQGRRSRGLFRDRGTLGRTFRMSPVLGGVGVITHGPPYHRPDSPVSCQADQVPFTRKPPVQPFSRDANDNLWHDGGCFSGYNGVGVDVKKSDWHAFRTSIEVQTILEQKNLQFHLEEAAPAVQAGPFGGKMRI